MTFGKRLTRHQETLDYAFAHPNETVLYLAHNAEQALLIFEACFRAARAGTFKVPPKEVWRTKREIILENGSRILFRSANDPLIGLHPHAHGPNSPRYQAPKPGPDFYG